MNFIIAGAGGHAKVLAELVRARGDRVLAYVDPKPVPWLDVPHVAKEEALDDRGAAVVIGIGGVTPEQLSHRLEMADRWVARGYSLAIIVHPSAVISPSARVEPGSVMLAQSVVQPAASIGRAAIINTGAIVEHDSTVDSGTHIAPGAILLGDVRVGRCCMIGAGAVLLPGTTIAPNTLIKAHTRHGEAKHG